jgi:hypothetical protein
MFKSAFSYTVTVLEHVTLGVRDLVNVDLPYTVLYGTIHAHFAKKKNLAPKAWF